MEDHFDFAPELEQALEKKGDLQTKTELRRISEMATVLYVRQREPLGLGHAVLCALPVVGNEPFAVILSDDVIFSETPAIKQLIDVYEKTGSSVVAVEQVAPQDISSYGIVDPKPAGPRLYEVERLVEKPKPEDAPSSLGIVGRYVLTPEVFKTLKAIPRGKLGEIQLTDGLQLLRKQQKIYAYEFEGKRYDAGSKLGYLKATVDYALARPDLAPEFGEYLSQICRTQP
jgi:UTP--glucose-1-phosphate uridylyltransferase